MQVSQWNESKRNMAKRALQRIAIDGVLGAVCGGLYGLVFGGFGALVHGEPWKLVSIAIHFGGWGLAIGALVGAYGAFFRADTDVAGSHDPVPESKSNVQSPIETVRHIIVPGPLPAPNSLTPATRSNRTRQTIGT
jgi:hypothetical protein